MLLLLMFLADSIAASFASVNEYYAWQKKPAKRTVVKVLCTVAVLSYLGSLASAATTRKNLI
jgi:hypothetical protein